MQTAQKPTVTGRALARAIWRLVRIYWTSPDWRWGALLLAGAITLELGTVWANVLVSEAQRDTLDALSNRDSAGFAASLALAVGFMLLSVGVAAYRVYV